MVINVCTFHGTLRHIMKPLTDTVCSLFWLPMLCYTSNILHCPCRSRSIGVGPLPSCKTCEKHDGSTAAVTLASRYGQWLKISSLTAWNLQLQHENGKTLLQTFWTQPISVSKIKARLRTGEREMKFWSHHIIKFSRPCARSAPSAQRSGLLSDWAGRPPTDGVQCSLGFDCDTL